jgi:hypothetical protein
MIVCGPAEMSAENLPNTGVEHYHKISLFIVCPWYVVQQSARPMVVVWTVSNREEGNVTRDLSRLLQPEDEVCMFL